MRAMAIYYALGAGAVVAAGAGVVVARNPELLPPSLRLQRVEPPAKIAALPSPAAAPSPSVAPMPTVAASPAAANKAAEPLPGFDIVRVERDGSAVIAGHAAPGEKVELRDGDKVLGSVVADDAGQFVFVPDSLSTGAHSLRLAALSPKGEPRLSTPSTIEVVGASAPAPKPSMVAAAKPLEPKPSPAASTIPAKPVVAAATAKPAEPAKPLPAIASVAAPVTPVAVAKTEAVTKVESQVTQAVAALAPAPAAATPQPKPSVAPVAPPSPALVSPTSSRLAVERVKATEPGRLEAEGDAEPGAKLRLTLNGSYLADVAAGVDGHWSLTIEHGMTPGLYALEARNTGAPGSPPARASFAYPQNPTPTSAPLVAARPADIVKPALETKPVDVAAPETLKAPEARTEVAGAETPKEAPTKAEAPKPEPAKAEPPKSALLPAEPPKPEPPREVAKADAPALAEPVKPAAVPSPLASAAPALQVPETPATAKSNDPASRDPSHAVVARVRTTTVVYGDNLWDLARKFYNDGSRYSEIYAANSGQIRNPSLIYIGQVFVVPQGGPVKQ